MSASRREALPVVLRWPLLSIALCSAITVAGLGSYYAGTSQPGPLDTTILATLDTWFPHAWQIGLAIDWCGEPAGAMTLSGLLAAGCLAVRRWRLAVLAVTSQGLIGGMTSLLKPVFERTIHGAFLSYPSGHTAGATALAIVLGLLLAQLLEVGRSAGVWLVLGVTGAVGLTAAWAQTLLVAHYATDTIGGFLTAVAILPPAALLIDQAGARIEGRLRSPRLCNQE